MTYPPGGAGRHTPGPGRASGADDHGQPTPQGPPAPQSSPAPQGPPVPQGPPAPSGPRSPQADPGQRPWQEQQPSGHRSPRQHSPSTADFTATDRKGLVAALLDVNFDHMVTSKLIKNVYVLALILTTLIALFVLLVGLWMLQFGWGRWLGVFIVPAAPVFWLFEMVLVRVFLEFMINQFKITEHLKAIRAREETR